jgi:DNA-binding protein H-NS
MLDGLDATGLGRVAEAAKSLRAEKQAAERAAFIARVREEAAAIGLRPEELFIPTPTRKPTSTGTRKRGKGTVPEKYRGPDGQTWSGRGKAPGWMAELERQGRSRDDFLISAGQPDLIETAKREHAEE